MRFLRHLTTVVIVLAVIVLAAVLWAHVSGGGGPGAEAVRRVPPPEVVERAKQFKTPRVRVGPDLGLRFSQSGDLVRTCLIESALAVVVITGSVARRAHRRARRRAAAVPSA